MKKILAFSTAALATLLLVAGCENDPNLGTSVPEISSSAQSADAHPAIAYTTFVTSKGNTYNAVFVCDSDGTDQTAISTASLTSYVFRSPTWSPAGNTIAYQSEEGSNDKIYLRDISVSHGKVSGGNTRSIYSASSVALTGTSWSSVSSTAKIAFSERNNSTGVCTVNTISTSGGTPTALYQSNSGETHIYASPTWNADDSRIAFIDRCGATGTSNPDTLRVIDASTGALLESVGLGSSTILSGCEWARHRNIVAYSLDNVLYYVTPTTGSTPWTNNASVGAFPTWSPDDSYVVTYGSLHLNKTAYSTSTTSTIANGSFSFCRWKR